MEGMLLSRDFEGKMRFCFIKRCCLLGEIKRFIKAGSVNGKSLYRSPIREPGGGFIFRGL
jgi:hypothetical protein